MTGLVGTESFRIYLPVLVTLILGLLGAVFTWLKDLSAGARRTRFLDEAIKGVAFWDSWVKALAEVAEVSAEEKAAVERELRRCVLLARVGFRNRRPPEEWTSDEFEVYKRSLGARRLASCPSLIQATKQGGPCHETPRRFGGCRASGIGPNAEGSRRVATCSSKNLYRGGGIWIIGVLIARFFAYALESMYISQLLGMENAREFCRTVAQRDQQASPKREPLSKE